MLHQLGQGVYAWLAEQPDAGHPNAGVVLDTDGATVVDTLCAPSQYEPFGEAVDALGFPVRRIVLTGDHIEFVGGTVRFATAGVYGTRTTSAHLDQPPDPAVYRALFPDLSHEFDDELRTRTVSHLVTEWVQLTPAVLTLPVDGQALTNLVALVADAGVLFAGAMCSFGVTPLAFDGNPARWADVLDEVIELADVIVPGHGPVGGAGDIRDLQGYLRACVAADGDPSALAAGPWDGWSARRWDEVNVERAAMLARGDASIPPSMLRAAGLS